MIYWSILDPNFVILKAVPIFGNFNMAGITSSCSLSYMCNKITQLINDQMYITSFLLVVGVHGPLVHRKAVHSPSGRPCPPNGLVDLSQLHHGPTTEHGCQQTQVPQSMPASRQINTSLSIQAAPLVVAAGEALWGLFTRSGWHPLLRLFSALHLIAYSMWQYIHFDDLK